MLLHVLVLSVFAAGMISVLVLSQMGPRDSRQARDMHEDPGEPGEELRAAA